MGDGVRVGGVRYYEAPNDPTSREFTVIENDGGARFMWLPEVTGDVQVIYDAKATDLTATTDNIDVPAPYDWYIIHGLLQIWKEIEDQDFAAVGVLYEAQTFFDRYK